MASATEILIRYTSIAVLASTANLAIQAVLMGIYDGAMAIEVSMFLGTAIVLPFKYAIEKRFIFFFAATTTAEDARHFSRYTTVSLFTVLIFWSIEYAFHLLFRTDAMRYIGGALGLGCSFYLKYILDKRFVFFKVS